MHSINERHKGLIPPIHFLTLYNVLFFFSGKGMMRNLKARTLNLTRKGLDICIPIKTN